MSVLLRLAQLLGLNAVPVLGLLWGAWSPATALALYWCENVLGSALVAVRIAMHREATGKRGHDRPQLGLRVGGALRVGGRSRRRGRAPRTLLGEFLWATGVFCVAHGLFLWLLLALVLRVDLDLAGLRNGVTALVALQLAGFALDFPRLGERPFAWIKALAERSVARVVLVHLAILGGAFLSFGRPHPERFFVVFGALKSASDLASWLPLALPPPDPERPPRLAAWLGARFPRAGESFAGYWRRTAKEQLVASEADEEANSQAEAAEP